QAGPDRDARAPRHPARRHPRADVEREVVVRGAGPGLGLRAPPAFPGLTPARGNRRPRPGTRAMARPRLRSGERSDDAHVARLFTLLAGADVELDLLAFVEGLV